MTVQTVSARCPTLGRFASGTSEVGVIPSAIWWHFPHVRAFGGRGVCGEGGGEESSTIQSPACTFYFSSEDQLAHTSSTF